MDKIVVNPKKVRGWGNVVDVKKTNDFTKHLVSISEADGDIEEGIMRKVFRLTLQGVQLNAAISFNNTPCSNLPSTLSIEINTLNDEPVEDLNVELYFNNLLYSSDLTDSEGIVNFTFTPEAVEDLDILVRVQPQRQYDNLEEELTIPVGVVINIQKILTDIECQDDEYIGTYETQIGQRSQLSQFVKDVWIADGGETIVDENNLVHVCQDGDLVVEIESLEQSEDYNNILFDDEVDLLSGSVYDMSISEDYEIILDCLERSDIVPDVSPVPVTFDGVSLTSDKSILSYIDGDSCILTAQLTDGGDPIGIEGVDVEFFKGEDTLGTVSTNSSGIATMVYSSLNGGDVTFTAVADDTITSSEIYVEDCFRYDGATTDKSSNYTSNNLNSLTFSTDHYEAYRSLGTSPSSTYYSPIYVDETLPSDFEMSVMYKASTNMNREQTEFIIAQNHPQTYSGTTELGIIVTDARRGLFHRVNGSATWYTESSTLSNNTWYTFYLKIEGTTVTAKILDSSDNTVYTSTQTISNAQNYKKWSIINGGNSRTLHFKNLKIKTL